MSDNPMTADDKTRADELLPVTIGSVWDMKCTHQKTADGESFICGTNINVTPETLEKINALLDELKKPKPREPFNPPDLTVRYP